MLFSLKRKELETKKHSDLKEHSTMILQRNEAISHLHTKKGHQNMTRCNSKRDLPPETLNGEACFPGDEMLLLGFEGHKIVFVFLFG